MAWSSNTSEKESAKFERDGVRRVLDQYVHALHTTARQTIHTVADIKAALLDYKHRIRKQFKFYSQDLINNLFTHPYTRIEFVQKDLGVTRLTATKYLELLANAGFLRKFKFGRTNYYINVALNEILTRERFF